MRSPGRLDLATLTFALANRSLPGLRGIYKAFAFLGRYGHQPISNLLALPMSEVLLLADEVEQLIRDENDAVRSKMETDG